MSNNLEIRELLLLRSNIQSKVSLLFVLSIVSIVELFSPRAGKGIVRRGSQLAISLVRVTFAVIAKGFGGGTEGRINCTLVLTDNAHDTMPCGLRRILVSRPA